MRSENNANRDSYTGRSRAMPTDVPIRVRIGSFWRMAETSDVEISEALKHMLLYALTLDIPRRDFAWILQSLGDFAKELCEKTEIQFYCIVANLSDIATKLEEVMHDDEDRDVQG